MNSRVFIEKVICDTIRDVSGIEHLEKDASLIGRDSGISPVDFLYIFDLLEKQLQMPVSDIFINYTFEVVTVNNLAAALINAIDE